MTAAATQVPALTLAGLGFTYGATAVLSNLDLEVYSGEVVACVGPSGCGKSTLLALLGGHLRPTRGTVTPTGASRTIYQDGGLYPWLTVAANVALGVPRAVDDRTRAARVADWLGRSGLADFADHYPHQLSGGMRQRVELGRALVADTAVLLLDEPFSALDYQTRLSMRRELAATLAERPRTVVLVTHDIEEAVQLADRIVVLSARPATVRRVLTLPPGRPRAPNAPGVADAEQTILEELGLS